MTEQIRPIGPRERDIEPVFGAQRAGRDGANEKRDPREGQPRREPRPQPPAEAPPADEHDDGGSGSLIDVRV